MVLLFANALLVKVVVFSSADRSSIVRDSIAFSIAKSEDDKAAPSVLFITVSFVIMFTSCELRALARLTDADKVTSTSELGTTVL